MATFIAAQSGQFNDGATWGNISPGVGGVDWPILGDTFTNDGFAVTVSGNQACSGGTVVNAADLIFADNASFGVDTGNLRFGETLGDQPNFTVGAGVDILFTGGANFDVTNGRFTSTANALNRSSIRGETGSDFKAIAAVNGSGSYNWQYTDIEFDTVQMGRYNNGRPPIVEMVLNHCTVVANDGDLLFGTSIYAPDTHEYTNCDFRWNSGNIMRLYATTTAPCSYNSSMTDCTFATLDGNPALCYANVVGIDIIRPVAYEVKINQQAAYIDIQYINPYGDWTGGTLFLGDGPFKGLVDSGSTRPFKVVDGVMYTAQNNAHFLGVNTGSGTGGLTSYPAKWDGNYIELISTGAQPNSNVVIPGSQPVDFGRNVVVGEDINLSGTAADTTIVGGGMDIHNNTVVQTNDAAVWDQFIVFENSASPVYDGTVNLDNNLQVGVVASTGWIRRSHVPDTQAVTTVRNNYGNTDAIIDSASVTGITITTESGNVLDYVDANFLDATRRIASYGQLFHGTDGSQAAMTAEALKINGFDPVNNTQVTADESGVDIVAMVAWLRAGFAPQDTTLSTAGYDGGLVGAVAVFTPTPTGDTIVILPSRQWVNLYEERDISVGTQINVQNVGAGLVYLYSGATPPEQLDAFNIIPEFRKLQNASGDNGAWAYSSSGGVVSVKAT